MNPWTSLLESLHSALIDELVANSKGAEKPELGMPCRFPHFELPPNHAGKALGSAVLLRVDLGAAGVNKGFVSVVADTQSAQTLWDMILKRAGGEFMRRGIQPKFSPPEFFKTAQEFADSAESKLPAISRLIWIPFKIKKGDIFLGIATFSTESG